MVASGLCLLLCAGDAAGQILASDGVVRNLRAAKRYIPEVVSVEIRDLNLSLGGLQIGEWSDPKEAFDLAAVEGLAPPCRSLQVDALATSFALVCPDELGSERLLLIQQGIVLRFPTPLVTGSTIGLSDDGARVAAIFDTEDGASLRVLDVQRTREIVLTGLVDPGEVALAGTGNAVACTAVFEGERRVVLVDLEQAAGRLLSIGLDAVTNGAVSANGRRVVFRGDRDGRPDYFLVDIDRQQLFNLTDIGDKGSVTSVDLAQHGDVVAFISRFGGAVGVFTADITARKVANRCGYFQPLHSVSVSATGSRVAFVKGGTTEELEVWDLSGREPRRIHTITDAANESVLSSDGLSIAALCPGGGFPATRIQLLSIPASE